MSAAAQLAAEVRRATEDQPYVVVDESPHGFAVQLDVVDARWWSLYQRNGLEKTWRWEVAVSEDGTYTITDREATLEWRAGADATTQQPTLSFSRSGFTGTKIELSTQKTFGIRDDGSVGKVVDYSFDSREGRGIITAAADRVGLRPGGMGAMGSQAKLGLTIAAVVVGGLVVGGILLAVLLVVLL